MSGEYVPLYKGNAGGKIVLAVSNSRARHWMSKTMILSEQWQDLVGDFCGRIFVSAWLSTQESFEVVTEEFAAAVTR